MTTSMKLFALLWIVMVTRVAGALIAGRQCLRLRHLTHFRQLYEWLTAFGVGLVVWGIADLGLVWNSVVNSPPNREQYPTLPLWYSIGFQLLETGGVWLITLVVLNGGTPGYIRKALFWMLERIKVMDKDKFFHKSEVVIKETENHDPGT